MNEPLSIYTEELMSKWVRLYILYKNPMSEILIELVDRWHVDVINCSVLNLPDVECIRDYWNSKLHYSCHNSYNNHKRCDDWIGKRIVLVTQESRPTKAHKDKSPSHQGSYIVELLWKTHVIKGAPRMDDASSKTFLVDPFFGSYFEFIFWVCKVIVNLVSPNALQQMQQKYVNDHLRKDNNARECEIVRQFSLSNSIPLRNLSLFCKQYDINEDEWHKQHWLSIIWISANTTK